MLNVQESIFRKMTQLFLVCSLVSACRSRSFSDSNSENIQNATGVPSASLLSNSTVGTPGSSVPSDTSVSSRVLVSSGTSVSSDGTNSIQSKDFVKEESSVINASQLLSSEEEDLVLSTAKEWKCQGRSEITLCQGSNGSGAGVVLWVLYRGPLQESSSLRMKLKIDKFQKDVLGTKIKSGVAYLITNGLQTCKGNIKCKDSSEESKQFFQNIAKEPNSNGEFPWKINLMFYAPSGPSDFGNPFYKFSF